MIVVHFVPKLSKLSRFHYFHMVLEYLKNLAQFYLWMIRANCSVHCGVVTAFLDTNYWLCVPLHHNTGRHR
jgi:hypothetical protein